MRYTIINLSPRMKGTSKMLTNYFADRLRSDINSVEISDLYVHLDDMDYILDKIKSTDSIILIGPSYINTFPADTISLLTSISNKEGVLHGQSLYGFIQGGMPYIHTHEHGIKLLELFCDENPVVFKGGFVMGGGAILDGQPLENIIGAKKIVPSVNEFIENIKANRFSSESLYKNAAMEMPPFITKMVVTMMNFKLKKMFKEKGINYKAQSPYS